jgi:flagellar biosynthesis chaperone FliJ
MSSLCLLPPPPYGTHLQDMKNAKSSLKKLTKSFEKEREKLGELEATPERCQKEIAEMEKKLKILEVCKMNQCG